MPRLQPDPPAETLSRAKADSRVSSAGSWAATSPFTGDPGPAFDPEAAQDQPAAATPLQLVDVAWAADRIKTGLRAQGILTHEALGVGERDWLWEAHELEAISEPLANVLNKFPVTRAAAAVSDELAVGAVLFEYSVRSIRERSAVIRAHKAALAAQRPPGPQPITGVAPEDVGARPAEPVSNVPPEWRVPE